MTMPVAHIDLYLKIITQPVISIDEMIRRAQQVYGPHDIVIRERGRQKVDQPEGGSLEVGDDAHPTADQQLLFRVREGADTGDICVYFVSEIKLVTPTVVRPVWGYSARQPGKASAFVARDAPKWTLAHELGHVLGLLHDEDEQRLMHESGDPQLIDFCPSLVWKELEQIHQHPTLVHSR